MNADQKTYLYSVAKAAKSGEEVQCPNCAKPFRKASYQQAFCSNSGASNCKDAYWTHVRAPKAELQVSVAADALVSMRRAVEHAGYLACGADSVFEKFNEYGVALMALEEMDQDADDREPLIEALDNARGDLQESLTNLRSLTYEFRKRASRAKAGSDAAP